MKKSVDKHNEICYNKGTNKENLKNGGTQKMITVNGNTKRAQELRARAKHFEGYDLYDVYGRVSRAKDTAYDECYEMYRRENGEDFRICGHCTTNFTVAWRVENGWRIETYRNSYLVLD